MDEKDDLQFIQDSFALARQEFINRQKEKEINEKMNELYKENLRIPIPSYPHREWFLENGWELKEYTYPNSNYKDIILQKEHLGILISVNVVKSGYSPKLYFIIADVRNADDGDFRVFKGDIQTEEEFKIVEKILLRG